MKYKRIVFDLSSRKKLNNQLQEELSDTDTPIRWHVYLNKNSLDISGFLTEKSTFLDIVFGRGRMFSWQPSIEVLAATFFKGGVVYLCWGLPSKGRIKTVIINLILKRSSYVVVNDLKTRSEIINNVGIVPKVIPFFIDTIFFSYGSLENRKDFIFCNGSNDRDPRILVGLAKAGHKIIWLVDSDELVKKYGESHHNLTLVRGVSHNELKRLYQSCRMKIMPISKDAHCAGQTTGMEAISCGAPLIISAGRTASIFKNFPSVEKIDDNSVDMWDKKIKILNDELYFPDWESKLIDSRELLCENISPGKLKETLNDFFSSDDFDDCCV